MRTTRTLFWLFMFLCLGLLLAPLAPALATGTPPPTGGDATAVGVGVGVGVGMGGSAAGGYGAGGSSSVNTKAYGAGSTGLTSTAACLGSFGALFNLASGTYVEPGCVHRYYTEQICAAAADPNACRFEMACMDPDLSTEVKGYIGCKPKAE